VEIKQIGQFLIALAIGVGLYYFWGLFRPEDPESYRIGVGLLGVGLSFAVLYFSTKE